MGEYNRLIFISHKYSDDPDYNKQQIEKISKYWYKKGYIPISTIQLFSYIEDDNPKDRELIMKISYYLIQICPTVAVYHQSLGCRLEEAFAELCNKVIYRMYNGGEDALD